MTDSYIDILEDEGVMLLKRSREFVALVYKCCRNNGEYAPLHWQEMVEIDRDLSSAIEFPKKLNAQVVPSLWEICVRDEPHNPESPCEYVYVNNVLDRDSILRQGGAYIVAEYGESAKLCIIGETKS